MQLTDERRQALKAILIQIFGEDFHHIKPTHRTLEITEKMLLEMHKCNDRIQRLFKSLHCANITRGFLTRCLKAVRDIIKNNPPEFRGCTNMSLNAYKWPIYASGMQEFAASLKSVLSSKWPATRD